MSKSLVGREERPYDGRLGDGALVVGGVVGSS